MANNKDENIEEKVKEAQKAVEEASKLAANAASGNIIGAGKNAMNLLKNKKTKRAMLISLIQPIATILIIILLAASLFGIWNAIKDALITFIGDVSSGISEAWKWLTDDYWIDLDQIVETDPDTGDEYTMVDKYIMDLDATGISLVDLGILGEAEYSRKNFLEDEEIKAKVEKYIAEFIRADLITQQPHKRSGTELVNSNNQNEIDGSVYLFRTKEEPSINESEFVNGEYIPQEEDVSSTEYRQMTYISYEEFTKMVTENDPNIRYHFSIDPDTEELLLAEIKKTTEVTDDVSNFIGSWFVSINEWLSKYDLAGKSTYEVTEIRIPYKDYIAKYTMPYEFLINLCQVTKNPEFVYHVALMARESKIILGVQDDTTIDRVTVEVEEDYEYYRNINSDSSDGAATGDITKKKKRTVTTTTTQTPQLRVEYADTWSFYEEFEYTAMLTGELTQSEEEAVSVEIPEKLGNYHPAEDATFDPNVPGLMTDPGSPEYWDDTFLIETRTNTQSIHTTKTYSDAILVNSVEKSKQFLGLLRNSTGTCGHNCYDVNSWKRQEPEALKCVEEAEFDREGKNVEYRIPNTTKTEEPLENLLSGLDMLYALLQSNSTGYEHKELTDDDIKQALDNQEDLINSGSEKEKQGNTVAAYKDYESAYVVKMQGLVEHLRYLMTFPENESYDIKNLTLDILLGDDEKEYEEGFNYGFWWPVNAGNSPITSEFGWRYHPVDKEWKSHNGIDIAVQTGTEVIATADGTVTYVGTNPNESAGLWIKIDHGNGISSVYMHLSEIKVQKGQVVSQGQVIALSGNTGKSTGPHLHFGISVNGTYVDPLLYVSATNRTPEKVEISEGTSNWRITVEKAFSDLGYTMTEEKVSRILSQISTESKGNQNIIQGIKDVNSGTKIEINNGVCPWCPNSSGKTCNNTNIGHGLLQFIPTTFESCKLAGHGDIFNGYDQICALIVNCETKAGGSYKHIGNGTGWSPK